MGRGTEAGREGRGQPLALRRERSGSTWGLQPWVRVGRALVSAAVQGEPGYERVWVPRYVMGSMQGLSQNAGGPLKLGRDGPTRRKTLQSTTRL